MCVRERGREGGRQVLVSNLWIDKTPRFFKVLVCLQLLGTVAECLIELEVVPLDDNFVS